jgi:glycosyltransferase involved in cell wall biosynthesis
MQLQREFDKVRVLQHPGGVNKGAGESRNLGIRQAQFPYIAFLDSDDTYLPNRFNAARKIFTSDPSVDGVYDVVWRKNIHDGKQNLHGIQEMIDPKDLFNRLAHGKYFHTNGITVKKKLFDSAGYFVQKYFPHEDNIMWMSMAYHGKLVGGSLEEPVSDHFVHNENSMQHAGVLTRYKLWKGAFETYFFKPISMSTRINLLERFIKFRFKSLMAHAGLYKGRF